MFHPEHGWLFFPWRRTPREAPRRRRPLRLEELEDRNLLHASVPALFPAAARGLFQSDAVVRPADEGDGGTPHHFLTDPVNGRPFAWHDEDPSTPGVIDVFYDFRDLNG